MGRLDDAVAVVTGAGSGIGAAAAFLVSEDASFITGHALVVGGGFTAGLRVGPLEQLGM